ncbi:NAD-dependent protein deacetylase [Myxococcus llanfairpwllgwyngyllgogerychwyrndrobwllllantysiliogogogochensis]|uniref:NAD-dependent protein deacetylase n=1 Tax=Myxococcus llanfairpwllgwyngyllgogerychwyrndrobwllllantysiliogogogochensis TaxID=2590453 RepID=A0A540WXE6_9BACT|nr:MULTISPECIES: NAD-dependent protein deacetylase [Myxococcus]NTX12928.1 NAD-dependent protein deacetylase [Myxococcus sp. CA056]NTX39459.1 NAD-dependent protein deacetylase [Myxococcus sp. CA033]TQF13671.1 NAD-dependent protein deacetylase [Myxococcus llanfairpwllgwyngyllgogerychwyrndrobwllllantysiliogogogochensis]
MTPLSQTSPVPGAAQDVDALVSLLRGRRTVVLTGAGCSTESGIPDYRGPGTRARARNPIQHREFLQRPEVRARYWARSLLGWPRFASAHPNPAHRALAALEQGGHVPGLITQNVDRLHHAAGSSRVIELHGALARVRCLDCGAQEARVDLQARLLALNPDFSHQVLELRPDGDAELSSEALQSFQVPACVRCGGTLKPDVVFFGDNVPAPTVTEAFALLEEGDALLVVGSSLAIYSGYRFLVRAAERHVPIAILNLGECRGVELADLRVEASAGDVLPRLAEALARS